jgi:hypothetical protein
MMSVVVGNWLSPENVPGFCLYYDDLQQHGISTFWASHSSDKEEEEEGQRGRGTGQIREMQQSNRGVQSLDNGA